MGPLRPYLGENALSISDPCIALLCHDIANLLINLDFKTITTTETTRTTKTTKTKN